MTGVLFGKALPVPSSVSLCFPSLISKYQPCDPLWIEFCTGWGLGGLVLLYIWTPVSPAFFKRSSLFSNVYLQFLCSQMAVAVCVCFCVLYSAPQIFMFIFVPIPCCILLWLCGIIWNWELWCLQLCAFCSGMFGCSGSFVFPYQFEKCLLFCEECHWYFDVDCRGSVDPCC